MGEVGGYTIMWAIFMMRMFLVDYTFDILILGDL